MRLTVHEKEAIRAKIRRDMFHAEFMLAVVRGTGPDRHRTLTDADWARLTHLDDVGKRLEQWKRCLRQRERSAATKRAEAHGYRPEFV